MGRFVAVRLDGEGKEMPIGVTVRLKDGGTSDYWQEARGEVTGYAKDPTRVRVRWLDHPRTLWERRENLIVVDPPRCEERCEERGALCSCFRCPCIGCPCADDDGPQDPEARPMTEREERAYHERGVLTPGARPDPSHGAGFRGCTDPRECPGCVGVPRGQAWLCSLCRGSRTVTQEVAVAYADGLVAEAQAKLNDAHSVLRKAVFG